MLFNAIKSIWDRWCPAYPVPVTQDPEGSRFSVATERDVLARVKKVTGMQGKVVELARDPGMVAVVDVGDEDVVVTESWRVHRMHVPLEMDEETQMEHEVREYVPWGSDVWVTYDRGQYTVRVELEGFSYSTTGTQDEVLDSIAEAFS